MISRTRLLASCAVSACALLGLIAPSAFGSGVAWSPVAITGPTVMPPTQSEVQRLWVDAEGGTYTLKFGAATTGPIAFNADPATVQAALNGLSSISGGGGSVSVTGGPGGPGAENPYSIAFGGSLANNDVPQLVTGRAGLTGAGQSAAVGTFVPGGPGTTTLAVYAQNIGAAASTGVITMKVKLPAGMSTTVTPSGGGSSEKWSCTTGAQTEFTCTLPISASVRPGLNAPALTATLTATPGTESGSIEFEVEGGSGAQASGNLPLVVSATPAKAGIQTFAAGAYDENGSPDTRAGDHPYTASAAIFANTKRSPAGIVVPAGNPRNILVDLPPGFLGNPIAVPQCPESVTDYECPLETVVGIATVFIQSFGGSGSALPVYNTEAPLGYPGKFRFDPNHQVPLSAVGDLRSEGDYGLTVGSLNTPQIAQVYGTFFTFWGAPADPSHDSSRCVFPSNNFECEASSAPNTAFLTNATNCAEEAVTHPITFLHLNSWEEPDFFDEEQAEIKPVDECENLHFEDGFTFEPSSTKADSTASFRTSLTVPSKGLTDPTKLTTPELKDMTVQLPRGVVLNASGADGLAACSLEQIGYEGNEFPMPNPMRFSKDPQTCPEASKIGTGELKSALLEEPLHGALYLAAQGNGNPFGSLFAVYLVIEDPRHGIFIKLPGEVEANKQTGQLEVIFHNLPQLPFTRLDLNLKGGDRSALASPTTCGTYTTTATGTPWSAPESGPPTETGQSFEINEGPNGGPCAKTPQERPFDLGWNAGAEKTTAGESGPFDFQVTRPDGSQEIEDLQLQTPQGVSASLKGVPYCTEAEINQAKASTGKQEQEHPACPAASQVGTATTGAGSGPSPFYTSGKLYLAGPYKGAPISVVAVTPAVAGPFDLGNVVVRSAVFIDRSTAQVTAKTDPIPQILDGVVLRIKDVRIHLDRSDWTINPTSCEPSSVKLIAHGNSGAVAERSTRFQVGSCDKLNFKPKLTGKVTGPTKRGDLPAFTATLTYPEGPGYANIKDVQVTLPHSEFLEQAHINTVCTRVQAAANACPQGSIYGYAEATTPLIDGVLKGPVFLKSSVHKLPDLAIALKGPENQPVEVEFAGRIDSV
ncbi:MAG TPA: hypothetical protein VHU86_06790, partial [Solirubrobacterales bacterium]|nr:hypothetical protein [Solirubrobacterales bacterium]